MHEPAQGLAEWIAAHEQAAGGELAGLSLVGRSAGAFVLPLIAALAGAMLAGQGEVRRFVGLLIGLAIGLLLAVAIGWWLGAPRPAPATPADGTAREASLHTTPEDDS